MSQLNTAGKLAYSINEFCEAVSIGRNKTYLEIKEGRLKTVKIGRRTVIRREDAEAWLNSMEEMQEGA